MVVFEHRFDEVRAGTAAAGAERVLPFTQRPAVVAPLGDDVDLFPQVLADVRCPEVPRLAVEGDPPQVAESGRPDFRRVARLADVGIVFRNAVAHVRGRVIDVDPQDLPQQRVALLAVAVRVVAAAAVTQADVQFAVGPKAIVPPLWFQYGCGILMTSFSDSFTPSE